MPEQPIHRRDSAVAPRSDLAEHYRSAMANAPTPYAAAGERHHLMAILVVALGARLLALAALPNLEFPDTAAYVASGEHLFTQGVLLEAIYMPLYPIWAYLWGGGWWLKIADILASTATVWVLHALTLEIFRDRRAALIAAAIAALYPHFIFFSIARLTETGYILVLCLALLLLFRDKWIAGAALLVACILIRPTLDLLAPVLVAAFAGVVHRHGMCRTARRLGAYVAIYIVLMTPWWGHNYAKYGEFVRLNLGDGLVLYSGNNPLNKSGGGVSYNAADRDVNRDLFDHIRDPVELNRAFREAAWQYIRENPGRFVELAAIKFVRFWRLWPHAPEYQRLGVIALSVLSYGTVLAFTVMFLTTEGRRWWRALTPLLLLTVYMTLVHMVTIGSVRYRIPLEPLLIVLAARSAATLSRHSPRLDRALVSCRI